MAIRFDASADVLSRSSPPSGDLTAMGWVYIAVDLNDYSAIFAVGSWTGGLRYIGTGADGTTLDLETYYYTDTGTSLSVGTWYHIALTDSDTNNRQRVYLNGVLDCDTADSANRQTSTLYVGNDSAEEYLNGRIAYVKVWNAELTQAEIQQEMYSIRPVRTANLWAWLPTFPGSGERARDYSGNGRNFTEGGTLADEASPPVGWGALPYILEVIAAGTEYPQAVAGVLTSAGAAVLRVGKGIAGGLSSAGVVVRGAQKVATGALASAGVVVRQAGKGVAGVWSGTGVVVRGAQKAVQGALTSAGVVVRGGRKAVQGALASAGMVVRAARKGIAGTLTSAGAAAKSTARGLAGVLTSAGAVASIKLYVRELAGTLTSAGALGARANKAVAGILTSAGAAVLQVRKVVQGTLTSAGAVATVKAFTKALAGTLTTAAALGTRANKAVVGVVSAAGSLARRTAKGLAGVLSASGGVDAVKQTVHVFYQVAAGTLTSAGSLVKRAGKGLAGALGLAGAATWRITDAVGSAIRAAMDLVARMRATQQERPEPRAGMSITPTIRGGKEL